jgi:hypothetical protein
MRIIPNPVEIEDLHVLSMMLKEKGINKEVVLFQNTILIPGANWRPDNWQYPYGDPQMAGEKCDCDLCRLGKVYEAGATAMLNALMDLRGDKKK